MTERDYYCTQDKERAEYDLQYEADMQALDEYINDAYTILEQAQSVLFFKRNVFSKSMNKKEFDDLIIEKIKELL